MDSYNTENHAIPGQDAARGDPKFQRYPAVRVPPCGDAVRPSSVPRAGPMGTDSARASARPIVPSVDIYFDAIIRLACFARTTRPTLTRFVPPRHTDRPPATKSRRRKERSAVTKTCAARGPSASRAGPCSAAQTKARLFAAGLASRGCAEKLRKLSLVKGWGCKCTRSHVCCLGSVCGLRSAKDEPPENISCQGVRM